MNTRFHLIVKNECEFQWHHIFSVFPSFYSHKLVYISIMWIMRNQSFHYSKKKYIVSCLAKTKAYFSISNFPPCYNTGFVNFEGKKYCSYKHPPTFFFFFIHPPPGIPSFPRSVTHFLSDDHDMSEIGRTCWCSVIVILTLVSFRAIVVVILR